MQTFKFKRPATLRLSENEVANAMRSGKNSGMPYVHFQKSQSPTNSSKKHSYKFGFVPKNANSPQSTGAQVKLPYQSHEKPRKLGVNQPMESNYIKTSQMKKSNTNIGTKKVQNLQKMQQENLMRQEHIAIVTTEMEASIDQENDHVNYRNEIKTPKMHLSQQFSNLDKPRK